MKSPCGVELERKSFAGERQIEDDTIVRVRSRHDGRRQTWWRDSVERLPKARNEGCRAEELGARESNDGTAARRNDGAWEGYDGGEQGGCGSARSIYGGAWLRWSSATVARG
jgi:hypothetical protein